MTCACGHGGMEHSGSLRSSECKADGCDCDCYEPGDDVLLREWDEPAENARQMVEARRIKGRS